MLTESNLLKHGLTNNQENTKGDEYCSKPPREQLEIGLPRKQLLARMIRIETNQLIISIKVIAEDWLRTIA